MLVAGVLDHGDDVNESYMVVDLVGFLKLLKREPLGAGRELLPQFPQGLCPPVLGPIEQDADCRDLRGILANETGKC